MQFITGVDLFAGLAWVGTFAGSRELYMAALAFTALRRARVGARHAASDARGPRPSALMCIAFAALSALGVVVFFHHRVDDPVGRVFIGPAAVDASEFFATLGVPFAEKARGFFHLGAAGWLLYLTWVATLNVAAGYHLMV